MEKKKTGRVAKKQEMVDMHCRFKLCEFERVEKAFSEMAYDAGRFRHRISFRELVVFLVDSYLAIKEAED